MSVERGPSFPSHNLQRLRKSFLQTADHVAFEAKTMRARLQQVLLRKARNLYVSGKLSQAKRPT